jgi:hypothetical protein
VKQVYEVVNLKQKYAEYEERVHGKITELIEGIPVEDARQEGVLKRIVQRFLEKIYKRTK